VRVTLDEPSRGRTITADVDGQRRPVAIATKVDVDSFRQRLLDVFASESPRL
jgi:hypothetical protein